MIVSARWLPALHKLQVEPSNAKLTGTVRQSDSPNPAAAMAALKANHWSRASCARIDAAPQATSTATAVAQSTRTAMRQTEKSRTVT